MPILTGSYRTKTYKIRLREWGYRKNIVLKDGQAEEVSNALSKQAQDPNGDIRLEDGSIVARDRLATQYVPLTTCLSTITHVPKERSPNARFSSVRKGVFLFLFSLREYQPVGHRPMSHRVLITGFPLSVWAPQSAKAFAV